MNNYSDYKSPQWQQRKSEIMALHDFRCQNCMKKGKAQLHVHHINYEYGRNIWDYDDNELLCLCDKCHKSVHEAVGAARWLIAKCARGELGIDALGFCHDLMQSMYFGQAGLPGIRSAVKMIEEMNHIFNAGIMEGSER